MTEDELVFVPLNKENVKVAGKIQYDIFHDVGLCGYCDFLDEINKETSFHSFLAFLNGQPVAISGLYEVDLNSDEAWVNWFGVVEEFRHQGIGTKVFEFTMKKAKELGKNTLRLFTFPHENRGGRRRLEYTRNLRKLKRSIPIF